MFLTNHVSIFINVDLLHEIIRRTFSFSLPFHIYSLCMCRCESPLGLCVCGICTQECVDVCACVHAQTKGAPWVLFSLTLGFFSLRQGISLTLALSWQPENLWNRVFLTCLVRTLGVENHCRSMFKKDVLNS